MRDWRKTSSVLDYEKLDPYPLTFKETLGESLSYRVEDKMRLSKDKGRLVVNKSLALAGIPGRALEYRLGNRSAVEWVIDQYQVHADARSGIVSDPNRGEDAGYIVRLVGQVVRVSLETVEVVAGCRGGIREFNPGSELPGLLGGCLRGRMSSGGRASTSSASFENASAQTCETD
ncbi:MAG: hypothetical protein JWN40_491 [Phycisphaerales bacterium]|nr:hypothetical protein [Phycisphaerales bacterium]